MTDRRGGGGVRGVMKGQVFEKVGVNVSTVDGSFDPEFAESIHGAAEDPELLRHRHQPGRAHGQPARARRAHEHALPVTTKSWFGGGADLNPPIAYEEDTADFHARLRAACARVRTGRTTSVTRHGPTSISGSRTATSIAASAGFSTTISKATTTPLCERNFALHPDVGEAFLDIFPNSSAGGWASHSRPRRSRRSSRGAGCYAEFNLVYDRGTTVRPQDRRQCRRHPDEPAA